MTKEDIGFKNILERRTSKPDKYTGFAGDNNVINKMLEDHPGKLEVHFIKSIT